MELRTSGLDRRLENVRVVLYSEDEEGGWSGVRWAEERRGERTDHAAERASAEVCAREELNLARILLLGGHCECGGRYVYENGES